MAFLKKKEEVIDLVLTRKGREMFAKGELNPTYYSFYDDEIIYDLAHADSSSSEPQSDSKTRIDTGLFLKNQTDWQTVKTTGQPQRDINPFFKELGTSSPIRQFRPSWDVRVQEGYISGSFSGSAPERAVDFTPPEYKGLVKIYDGIAIPQIDLFCDYDVTISKEKNSYEYKGENFDQKRVMLLATSSKDIALTIEEHNVEEEDFELEVFQYDYDTNETPTLKRLYFTEDRLAPDVVSYFFNIKTDTDSKDLPSIKFITDGSDPSKTGFKEEEDDC